jgi:Transposase DDE domain
VKNNLQSILSAKFNICNKIITYIVSILTTVTRKNCSSMARENGIDRGIVNSIFENAQQNIKSLKECLALQAKKLIEKNPSKARLVVDFTQLLKPYSQKIENVSYDRNGCTNRPEKGITLGTIAVGTGDEFVPFNIGIWVQERVANEKYKKKTDIAKELIKGAIELFGLLEIRLDGAFSSEHFLRFLISLGIKFVIRIPSNRVVIINEVKGQLKKIFRLTRNERAKLAKGSYKGIEDLDFVAEKRLCKNGEWETVYLVGNMDLSAKEYIQEYSNGAAIEKFFRTSKQYLGIGDCQMLNSDKQQAHIFSTFLAYVFASQQKIAKKKNSPEDIINSIRSNIYVDS